MLGTREKRSNRFFDQIITNRWVPEGVSALLHLHDHPEGYAACLGEGTAEPVVSIGFYVGQCTVQLRNGYRSLCRATDARAGHEEKKEELSASGDHHHGCRQLL